MRRDYLSLPQPERPALQSIKGDKDSGEGEGGGVDAAVDDPPLDEVAPPDADGEMGAAS